MYLKTLDLFSISIGAFCYKASETVAHCDVAIPCDEQSTTSHGSVQFSAHSDDTDFAKVKVNKRKCVTSSYM